MSKQELLRRAEPTVTVGFVPPVLARQVPDPRAGPRAAARSPGTHRAQRWPARLRDGGG